MYKYNHYGKLEQTIYYLVKPDSGIIGAITGIDADTVSSNESLKDSPSSIEFYVYEIIDGEKNNLYDCFNRFMEIHSSDGMVYKMQQPTISNDGNVEKKFIKAYSLEVELQQYDLTDFDINTGSEYSAEMLATDNLTEDGIPKSNVTFHNTDNPELSLLDLILKGTEWTVGYVDNKISLDKPKKLADEVMYFQESNIDRYTFLLQKVTAAFECVFLFNTKNRTVNAYRVENLGKDTNLYISFRNLQKSVNVSVDEDNIYTVFNVSGDNGLSIEYVNFGETEIEDYSYFLSTKFMSQELINKYIYWRDYRESRRDDYIELSKEYNAQLDIVSELYNRVPNDGCSTDWSTFSDDELLNARDLYQAQISGYESLYVDDDGNFSIDILKLHPSEYRDYCQIKDIILTNIDIEIENRQLEDEKDNTDYVNSWETTWDYFGLDELKSKLESYQDAIDVAVKKGYNKPYDSNSEFTETYHNTLYQTYLDAKENFTNCQNAIDQRQSEVDEAESILSQIQNERLSITEDVNKRNLKFGFSDSDLSTLNKLYNRTDYQNENILTTTLDTTVTTVDVQYELLKSSREELETVSQPQMIVSTTQENLLTIPEFKDMINELQLGNFIHVGIRDDYVLKLRVIGIERNPILNDNNLNITFSNMIMSKSKRNDFADILDRSISSAKNQISAQFANKNSTGNEIAISDTFLKAILGSSQFQNQMNSYYVDSLLANSGAFSDLFVKALNSNTINTDTINSNSGFFKYLESILVVSTEIKTDDLKAKLAEIDVALVGNLFTESLQSLSSTVIHETVNESYILSAIIGKLSVGDLAAGSIILNNNMQIISENGKMIMNGNALQMLGTDSEGNDYVGIQLGYDATSNPSLILRNENGATILTPSGITKDAIADGLIINDMIQDKTLSKDKFNFNVVEADDNGAINVSDVVIDGEGINAKFVTMKKEIESNVPYNLYISSSNGIRMSTGIKDTVLTVSLYRRDEDVTDQYDDKYFIWTRNSSDSSGDTYWNEQHSTGSKELKITRADVYGGAVFKCSFTYNGEIIITS